MSANTNGSGSGSGSGSGHRRSVSVPVGAGQTDYPLLQPESLFYNEDSQRVSNLIDEDIKRESRLRQEAKKRTIKVMLLGQAESGKSTLLKQFQLLYASKTLDSERPSWKPVVHFNIIKAVRMILDELDYAFQSVDDVVQLTAKSSKSSASSSNSDPQAALDEINALRSMLNPLIATEKSLAVELNGGVSLSGGRKGVFVRSGWQGVFSSTILAPGQRGLPVSRMSAKSLLDFEKEIGRLWANELVKVLLTTNKLRLEESAAFFLDNLNRIVQPDYLPLTEDILAVRLQTLGVVEHSISISLGGLMYDWRLYDVGGARGQRPTWIPFFDDATAIIFLAPISAFDQYLEEDPRINRIDDSLQLFSAIVENQLLKNTHLVLLLNKTDLLQKKLESGIHVNKFITSFGKRENTTKTVAEYFRAHFTQTHKKKDVGSRTLFVHFTSMLNIEATQKIIVNVAEAILREHVRKAGLI